MGVEENIKIVNLGSKAQSDKDFELLESLFAADAIAITPDISEPIKGSKAIVDISRQYFESFPDSYLEKEVEIGQEDWVCLAGSWNGTNTGPLIMPDGKTLAATKKRVKVPICILFKLKDGKIIEERDYFDQIAFMTQLGLSQQ